MARHHVAQTSSLGRRALAPAVGLFAVVAIGVLFGPLGLVLGYPLAIVTDVAVRKLYVREPLGEDVVVTGES
jgi:predicted PurR-regulated permease PerM